MKNARLMVAMMLCLVVAVGIVGCGTSPATPAMTTAPGSTDKTTAGAASAATVPAFTGESPSARGGHAMAYDPVSSNVILFGGVDFNSESDEVPNDTWAYDSAANTWTSLNPSGDVPEGRLYPSMVYDPASRRIILFGGVSPDGMLGDTWAYDPAANSWTKLAGSTPPTTDAVSEQKAQDAEAKSLVRNAMTAIESAYVDARTFDPKVMTPELLQSIEPSVTFVMSDDASAAISPTAEAPANTVNYSGTATSYEVGTVSASGTSFGVTVDKSPNGGNTLYINGVAQNW
jgi:hypothetical protein